MPTLEEIREKIDEIDRALVELLERRATLALQVREAKEKEELEVYSPAREREILDRVKEIAREGVFPLEPLERIFREIVSATRFIVGELVVAYFGPEFSTSHSAAMKQFGEQVRLSAGSSIRDVFDRVAQGSAQYGVVPCESSGSGLVTATYEAFLESPLQVVAEVVLPAQLDLVAREGSLSDVRRVNADAVSFVRSERWLRTNLPSAELVVVEGGALLSRLGSGSAAVVPRGVADRLELKPLAQNVADDLFATNRSFVIGRSSPGPTGRDKTSLICTVRDRTGALVELLVPLQRRGLSLSKIESRPLRGKATEYMFFIDVLGHSADGPIAEAINELRSLSESLHLIGSYPAV